MNRFRLWYCLLALLVSAVVFLWPQVAYSDHDPNGPTYREREEEVGGTLIHGWYTPEEYRYIPLIRTIEGSIGATLLMPGIGLSPLRIIPFALLRIIPFPPLQIIFGALAAAMLIDAVTDNLVIRSFKKAWGRLWGKSRKKGAITGNYWGAPWFNWTGLFGQLNSMFPDVRAAALEALGGMKDPEVVLIIRQHLLTEKNPRVRLVGQRVLSEMLTAEEPVPMRAASASAATTAPGTSIVEALSDALAPIGGP